MLAQNNQTGNLNYWDFQGAFYKDGSGIVWIDLVAYIQTFNIPRDRWQYVEQKFMNSYDVWDFSGTKLISSETAYEWLGYDMPATNWASNPRLINERLLRVMGG